MPGFSIADDARSIRTVDTSGGGLMGYGAGGGGGGGAGGIGKRHRESKDGAASVAKIIRRLRGEGLRLVTSNLGPCENGCGAEQDYDTVKLIGWQMRIARNAMIANR